MSDADQPRLAALRAGIDALDDHLLQLLSARTRLVKEIWAIKADLGLGASDPAREAQMRERLLSRANELGLDPKAIEAVLATIIGKNLSRPPGERRL